MMHPQSRAVPSTRRRLTPKEKYRERFYHSFRGKPTIGTSTERSRGSNTASAFRLQRLLQCGSASDPILPNTGVGPGCVANADRM
jgi:hypothetical protein